MSRLYRFTSMLKNLLCWRRPCVPVVEAPSHTSLASSVVADSEKLTNDVGMTFVRIPPSRCLIESCDSKTDDQGQPPMVTSQPFYLGIHPVTQAQWQSVMGNNPSQIKGELTRPVETVSWSEVQAFLERLSERDGGRPYILPSSTQWEYACRAESTGAYCFGDDVSQLDEYDWYEGNANRTSHPVGQKKPNAWGLHDMHGNVWEWCQDPYRSFDTVRGLRGGCYLSSSRFAQSSALMGALICYRLGIVGFRCASPAPSP